MSCPTFTRWTAPIPWSSSSTHPSCGLETAHSSFSSSARTTASSSHTPPTQGFQDLSRPCASYSACHAVGTATHSPSSPSLGFSCSAHLLFAISLLVSLRIYSLVTVHNLCCLALLSVWARFSSSLPISIVAFCARILLFNGQVGFCESFLFRLLSLLDCCSCHLLLSNGYEILLIVVSVLQLYF